MSKGYYATGYCSCCLSWMIVACSEAMNAQLKGSRHKNHGAGAPALFSPQSFFEQAFFKGWNAKIVGPYF